MRIIYYNLLVKASYTYRVSGLKESYNSCKYFLSYAFYFSFSTARCQIDWLRGGEILKIKGLFFMCSISDKILCGFRFCEKIFFRETFRFVFYCCSKTSHVFQQTS